MASIIVILIVSLINIHAQNSKKMTLNTTYNNSIATATFAGGCFWCTEAIFQELDGVKSVVSGFTGGTVKNPAYREVVTGRTGHAEAIRITYDPNKISYKELLAVFFSTHNPTTLNRQGYDEGTQYRSAIFYHNESQKKEAELEIATLTAAKVFDSEIVTEVKPFNVFYLAEDYHQDYYSNNKSQPYCQNVINPKLQKFLKKYHSKIKV
ncbi:MAG: peptide-methionine (S)-S-oxide reductase [Flavobacteriaceae bacterium CG1_02_35_72]|nr:MAG: peptide-methionine (S)-S-oxide reductase [Flavobacteriaceae bacterium CG1_02_35_72]